MRKGQVYYSEVTDIHYKILTVGYEYFCEWRGKWIASYKSQIQLSKAGLKLKLVGNIFRLK